MVARAAVDRLLTQERDTGAASAAGARSAHRRAVSRLMRAVAARIALRLGLTPVWDAEPGDAPWELEGLSPEGLGRLYEQLLSTEACRSGPGERLLLREVSEHRKRRGAYYTGDRLAQATSERTLAPLLSGGGRDAGSLRICDPAMGSGAFLLAAFRTVRRATGGRVVPELHGFDLDPLAVEVARLALWIEAGDQRLPFERLAGRLVRGDGLRRGETGSFDAVLGNPPWEIVKPNSREFFGQVDPGHRRLSQAAARRRQAELMDADLALRRRWNRHLDWHRVFSNTVREDGRFRLQGQGDLNTYKLFLERGLALLRPGGQLGLVLPSGLAFDLGAAELREHLLSSCDWRWLFQFENRNGLFDIHRSYKFGPVVVQKGGATRQIRTAFMRRDPADWDAPEPDCFRYPAACVRRFSPGAGALLEIGGAAEFELLEKIYGHSRLLGDLPGLRYLREFDLTNHARLFLDPKRLLRDGFRRDRLDRLVRGPGEVALPLFQGVMLRSFDCAATEYRGGHGSRADWCDPPTGQRRIRSRFAVRIEDVKRRAPGALAPRLAFRDVQNACNERTMIASMVAGYPCGNTVPTLTFGDFLRDLALLPILCSYPLDRVLRLKMSQNHVNWFLVRELPVPRAAIPKALLWPAARLALSGPWFRREWRLLERHLGLEPDRARGRAAAEPGERRRLRAVLDAVVALLYGLDRDDLELLLRDCAHPASDLKRPEFRRSLDPKGFWREDRELPPEDRQAALTLVAFAKLTRLAASVGRDRAVVELCSDSGAFHA